MIMKRLLCFVLILSLFLCNCTPQQSSSNFVHPQAQEEQTKQESSLSGGDYFKIALGTAVAIGIFAILAIIAFRGDGGERGNHLHFQKGNHKYF